VTGALFVGYVSGVALILFRLAQVRNLRQAILDGFFGVDQLDPRLDFEPYFDYLRSRFPRYVYTEAEPWALLAITLFVATFLALGAARLSPLRFAPGHLGNAPAPARNDIARFWRDSLQKATSGMPSGWWISIALLLGLAGAILTELHSLAVIHAAYASSNWALMQPSPPAVGVAAREDAMWLFLAATLLPVAGAIIAARRCVVTDPEFRSRWCLSCGYPRPNSASLNVLQERTAAVVLACSECGAPPPAPPVKSRWRPFAGVAIVLAFVLLLTAHAHAVAVAGVVRGFIRVQDAADWDTAVVRPGFAVLVERPEGRIWLRIAPPATNAGAGAGSRLVVIVEWHGQSPADAPLFHTVPLVEGRLPPVIEIAAVGRVAGGKVNVSVNWQEAAGIAHVNMNPRGASSIRAVSLEQFPTSE
jgi:hypothetical protein